MAEALPCKLQEGGVIVTHTGSQAREGGGCGTAIWGTDKPGPMPEGPPHPSDSSSHGHRT
jgi:hypothetical protein